MRLHLIVAQLHKWIALIIGIQIVLWLSGGFVMSFFAIEKVKGEHNVARPAPQVIGDVGDVLAVDQLLATAGIEGVKEVRLNFILDRLVYVVSGASRTTGIFDARTGDKLNPIDEAFATAIARADFSGEDEIKSVELLQKNTTEYRGPVPVWQVLFDDPEHTALYMSPDQARIVARVNRTWRIYDFFWMLHIMDYDEREDFNHPLLVTASVLALFVGLSGIGLLLYRMRKRDARIVHALVRGRGGLKSPAE